MATAVKQESIFVRIDAEEKKEVEEVCAKIGITPATAAKMFFKQLVKDRALPFKPKADSLPWSLQHHSKKEILAVLEESQKNIEAGNFASEEEFNKFIEELKSE